MTRCLGLVALCLIIAHPAQAEGWVVKVQPEQIEFPMSAYSIFPIDLCTSEYGDVARLRPLPASIEFIRLEDGDRFYLLKEQIGAASSTHGTFAFEMRDGQLNLSTATSIRLRRDGVREIARLDVSFFASRFQQRNHHGYIELEPLFDDIGVEDSLYSSALCPASFRPLQTNFFDLEINTDPAGASVYIDGELTEFQSNLTLRLPVAGNSVSVILQKEGFVSEIISVIESGQISAVLIPEPQ